MSKEHVFPKWLREIFPRAPDTTHTIGVFEWASSPGRSPAKETRKLGQGHSGSKKIRHVCRSCNSEWLSTQIEDIARPILGRLINGDAVIINRNMQRILSMWATKTVMTAEYIHPSKVVIHQTERTWLINNLVPPIGWNIWIGTYHGTAWAELSIQQHAGKLCIPTVDDGNPAEHNLEFTIFGMRRLMFVVVSSTWPRMWEIIETFGNPHPSLCRIWPITQESISWPRTLALTDADADQMAAYYLREVLAQHV